MAKIMLTAADLRMSYGDRTLLDIDQLNIYSTDRIGLIGENGAGKTTLLKILAGEMQPEGGRVRRFVQSAVIHQEGFTSPGEDQKLSALLRTRESRESLSGGEMTRNRIAQAFSLHPELLMADEPTTDLDEEGLRVLWKMLVDFSGAILLISHDRALLKSLCNRIWYLRDGKILDFPGGYDDFIAERDRRMQRETFEYEQYKAEKKRLKESAQKMVERASQVRKAPGRMGNSEARLHKREWTDSVLQLSHAKRTLQNRMEHLEVKEKPKALPEIKMKLGIFHPVEAKTALECRCDQLVVGQRELLRDTGFVLPTGSRTALIGPNGCGKTSLLRALMNDPDPAIRLEGRIRWNPAVRIGRFDQHHEQTLDMNQSVLINIMETSVYPEHFARTVMACLGLRGEAVFKPLGLLSGGEKAKTALGKLLLMDCNTLLLDEPTNHLDLFTMEELEKLLSAYGGTLLLISHDEELIRKTATRIIRFDGKKLVTIEDGRMERESNPSRTTEAAPDRSMEISLLEMRMAVLSSRMSRPLKGDRPDELQQEYFTLADKIRELKKQE
ncbi:MAG: ABC-F family ATP-binding cassette domain-containing protein [Clostridia bacterium]|nr:ABC-F family ATP-binding cassette domain-containing protein [Clostridia bacterium]